MAALESAENERIKASGNHFYDENQKDLMDIDDADVEPVKINTRIPGKKIKSVEVLVKVEDTE